MRFGAFLYIALISLGLKTSPSLADGVNALSCAKDACTSTGGFVVYPPNDYSLNYSVYLANTLDKKPVSITSPASQVSPELWSRVYSGISAQADLFVDVSAKLAGSGAGNIEFITDYAKTFCANIAGRVGDDGKDVSEICADNTIAGVYGPNVLSSFNSNHASDQAPAATTQTSWCVNQPSETIQPPLIKRCTTTDLNNMKTVYLQGASGAIPMNSRVSEMEVCPSGYTKDDSITDSALELQLTRYTKFPQCSAQGWYWKCSADVGSYGCSYQFFGSSTDDGDHPNHWASRMGVFTTKGKRAINRLSPGSFSVRDYLRPASCNTGSAASKSIIDFGRLGGDGGDADNQSQRIFCRDEVTNALPCSEVVEYRSGAEDAQYIFGSCPLFSVSRREFNSSVPSQQWYLGPVVGDCADWDGRKVDWTCNATTWHNNASEWTNAIQSVDSYALTETAQKEPDFRIYASNVTYDLNKNTSCSSPALRHPKEDPSLPLPYYHSGWTQTADRGTETITCKRGTCPDVDLLETQEIRQMDLITPTDAQSGTSNGSVKLFAYDVRNPNSSKSSIDVKSNYGTSGSPGIMDLSPPETVYYCKKIEDGGVFTPKVRIIRRSFTPIRLKEILPTQITSPSEYGGIEVYKKLDLSVLNSLSRRAKLPPPQTVTTVSNNIPRIIVNWTIPSRYLGQAYDVVIFRAKCSSVASYCPQDIRDYLIKSGSYPSNPSDVELNYVQFDLISSTAEAPGVTQLMDSSIGVHLGGAYTYWLYLKIGSAWSAPSVVRSNVPAN